MEIQGNEVLFSKEDTERMAKAMSKLLVAKSEIKIDCKITSKRFDEVGRKFAKKRVKEIMQRLNTND